MLLVNAGVSFEGALPLVVFLIFVLFCLIILIYHFSDDKYSPFVFSGLCKYLQDF